MQDLEKKFLTKNIGMVPAGLEPASARTENFLLKVWYPEGSDGCATLRYGTKLAANYVLTYSLTNHGIFSLITHTHAGMMKMRHTNRIIAIDPPARHHVATAGVCGCFQHEAQLLCKCSVCRRARSEHALNHREPTNLMQTCHTAWIVTKEVTHPHLEEKKKKERSKCMCKVY